MPAILAKPKLPGNINKPACRSAPQRAISTTQMSENLSKHGKFISLNHPIRRQNKSLEPPPDAEAARFIRVFGELDIRRVNAAFRVVT